MRISSLAFVLALASCEGTKGEAASGKLIACALDGSKAFEKVCTLERLGNQMVIHRQGGGFRRFALGPENDIQPVDGADRTWVGGREDGLITLEIADDRYLIEPGDIAVAP